MRGTQASGTVPTITDLEARIVAYWEKYWKNELPVRPFPLSRNISSQVWFIGIMPSTSGEILRLSDDRLENWSSTASDRFFAELRQRYGFEHAYLTDLVKAGPAKARDPSAQEVAGFEPFLIEELELSHPALVIAIGKTLFRDSPGLVLARMQAKFGFALEWITSPAYAVRFNRRETLEKEFRTLASRYPGLGSGSR
jgi:uracil-DNA glycosylase family 4